MDVSCKKQRLETISPSSVIESSSNALLRCDVRCSIASLVEHMLLPHYVFRMAYAIFECLLRKQEKWMMWKSFSHEVISIVCIWISLKYEFDYGENEYCPTGTDLALHVLLQDPRFSKKERQHIMQLMVFQFSNENIEMPQDIQTKIRDLTIMILEAESLILRSLDFNLFCILEPLKEKFAHFMNSATGCNHLPDI